MAFLTCHLFSHALGSNIVFNVCLPTPSSGEPVSYDSLSRDYGYDRGLPVAYLLHGMFGDYDSWIRYSNVDRYAQNRRIAVVTCSAANSFYQDMAFGPAYETFFTRELPAYICALFPVSSRREDTFIGGLSMGGYGAWHLALAAPERYSKAASLSGALDLVTLYQGMKDNPQSGPFNWTAIFGNPDAIAGSHSDLFAQYHACVEKGCVPKLYQACGTEDFLYQLNLSVRDRLLAEKADLIYRESPGIHDWNFWDREIPDVLDWFLEGRESAEQTAIIS